MTFQFDDGSERRLTPTGEGAQRFLDELQALGAARLVEQTRAALSGDATVLVRIEPDGTGLRWSIQDSGIGIPPASQSRLFEKFYRAENVVTLETEGTGLGLYLVRLIMDQLAGTVWCESEEGAGATFFLTLPRAEPGR